MHVNGRWKVPLWIAAVVVVLAGGYVAFDALDAGAPTPPAPEARTDVAAVPPAPPSPPLPGGAGVPRGRDGGLDLVQAAVDSLPPPPEPQAAPAPSPVDLERIRAKLPDNLFWETGAPTKDPELLKKRADAEREWNTVFGRVQSGEASEEEIQRYYDYRRELSEDYIAVARTVLSEYGDTLPEQERGLYELSINMHTTRLQEMPRKREEALARRQAQAQRQREWKQGGGN